MRWTNATRYALIGFLKDFCLKRTKPPNSSPSLKFLVTSRPYQDIEQRFNSLIRHLPTVHLAGEDESASIGREFNLVIETEIRNIGSSLSLDSEMQDHLENRLLSITHRTYLWLELVLAEIQLVFAVTRKQLDRTIDRLPESVDAAYTAILDRSRDVRQAKRLLHIILVAKRPLTVKETNVAFNMTENCKSYDDLVLESTSSFQKRIRNLCGLFVSITDSRVYLIHQTAKEFLVSSDGAEFQGILPNGPWKHAFLDEESNLILGRIFLWLLGFAVFENEPPYIDPPEKWPLYDPLGNKQIHDKLTYYKFINLYPFVEYAGNNWAAHIRQVRGLPCTDLGLAIDTCDPQRKGFSTWFFLAQMWGHRHSLIYSRETSKLHVAAGFHLPSLVKPLLELGADVDARDGVGEMALLAVVKWSGYEIEEMAEVVTLLLKSGASLDLKDDAPPYCRFSSPIKVSRSRPKDRRSILTGASDGFGYTALQIATSNKHTRCMEVVLQNGASIHDIEPRYGDTVLHWATLANGKDVLQTLLQAGANIEAENKLGQTALHIAAEQGSAAMVKMLLDAGADANATACRGDTPLHRALRSSILKDGDTGSKIKMLLQAGSEIKAKNEPGQIALFVAILDGPVAMAKMLLDAGADINATDCWGEKPLHYAARWRLTTGEETTSRIEMLLQAGSDIEAKNEDGETAIQHAIKYENREAVRSLLDAGADIDSDDYAKYIATPVYVRYAQSDVSSSSTSETDDS